ncbi:MAG: alanine dehydrogenase [Pseudomonadales bacterium]|nr:alanine dehydrogenase [Pseudomonadales bacterium]
MRIGVPKEIKIEEYRVGLIPESAAELVASGHEVIVESGAGTGVGFADADYACLGVNILANANQVFEQAELIVKVKEPQLQECAQLRRGQVLFTYLHLAADKPQADALMKSGVTAIAYETVTAEDGTLPLLTPMSEVAGRMSVQVGAYALQKAVGGRGILLGGVPGVAPAKVVIIGGGIAGSNAASMALGLQANVTIIDKSVPRLRWLNNTFGPALRTVMAHEGSIREEVESADLVIGAVLVPGGAAPKLVSRRVLQNMQDGSAVVDISIDQGGCFETSRPTTHDHPTYIEEGIVHYCVTNMPGAVPRTACLALNNVTLPFIRSLADRGWREALSRDSHFAAGLNVHEGSIMNAAVGKSLGYSVSGSMPVGAGLCC